MKLALPVSAARALLLVGIATRVFFGIIIDLPELYGSAWLASLLGAILFLPLALIADAWTKKHPQSPALSLGSACGKAPIAILSLFSALAILWESACIAHAVASSASIIALKNESVIWILFILMCVIAFVLFQNGSAIGASSILWKKLFPWVAGIVVLVQLRSYQAGYLAPILGKGVGTLLQSACRVASWYALFLPVWLITETKDKRPMRIVPLLFSACATATGLLVLYGMMTPATIDANHTRIYQLTSLIANGRCPTALQMPLIFLWFGSLLYLLSLEGFTSARLLQQTFSKLDGRICCVLAALAIFGIAALGIARRTNALWLATWQFPAFALAWIVILAVSSLRKGGSGKCANAA